MAQKLVQMATSLNKYSFHCIHMLTPLGIKTNPRENRFFAAKWTIGEKKGTHNVKFLTEKITTGGELTSQQVDKLTNGRMDKLTSGQVNELIVLFSFLEKCVFSPWRCPSKLDIVHLA